MKTRSAERRTLQLLANLLEYPSGKPAEEAEECAALVSPTNGEAADKLRQFQAFAAATPMGRLEEVYTNTFDLDATCHPYIGYHLFGESYKRSTFLLELKDRYKRVGFVPSETELPDRLSVLLRYLSITKDEEDKQEIINEGLLPTLKKMEKVSTEEAPEGSEDAEAPDEEVMMVVEKGPDADEYRNVLQALELILRDLSVQPQESQV